MIEKMSGLAEKVVTRVSLSRRGFFGQLGRGAAAVAGALAGLLITSKPVCAADPELGACTLPDLVTCQQTTKTYCELTIGGTWAPGPCPPP